MTFYTYIYRDPSRNNEPIYVGKGQRRRAYVHLKLRGKGPFISRLKYMSKNNINPSIEIIDALSESHSFLMEESLIEIIGRKDLGKGPLLNLTNGGEGVAGITWSAQRKDAWSISRFENNPMSGKTQSADAKTRIGQSQPKIRHYTFESRKLKGEKQTGEKNAMYGKPPTNSIPVVFNNRYYPSIKQAAKENNMTRWVFLKMYGDNNV